MSKRILASICAFAGLAAGGCLEETTGPQCQQVSTLVTGTSGDTVTIVSGLRYIDTEVGTGLEAKSCQVVSVNYVGQLTNGTVFDQSTSPYAFIPGSGQLISGFEQGTVGMKVGGSRRLIIPPSLAYGATAKFNRDGEEVIPANSTLIFDLELVATQESVQ